MKKFLLLGCLGAALFGLASCNSDNDGGQSTSTLYTYNLVTDLTDEEAPSVIGSSSYVYVFYFSNAKVDLGCKSLALTQGATAGTFSFELLSYSYSDTSVVIKAADGAATFNGMPINNFKCLVTPNYLWWANTNVNPGISVSLNPQERMLCRYNVGDQYLVQTVYPDVFYSGTTTMVGTDADGNESTSTSTTPFYRVIIDTEAMTADMCFYQMSLSGNDVLSSFVVKGLSLEMEHGTYVVRGTGITPNLVEGWGTTADEQYVFNDIEARVAGQDLTVLHLSYSVAGLDCSFKGSSIVSE